MSICSLILVSQGNTYLGEPRVSQIRLDRRDPKKQPHRIANITVSKLSASLELRRCHPKSKDLHARPKPPLMELKHKPTHSQLTLL